MTTTDPNLVLVGVSTCRSNQEEMLQSVEDKMSEFEDVTLSTDIQTAVSKYDHSNFTVVSGPRALQYWARR